MHNLNDKHHAPFEQEKGELTILIAEDNEINLMVLTSFLKFFDCKVLIAKDGRKAVNHFENNDIDLILMDVSMPEMDGFMATKEIRRIEKERNDERTPIIAVTAHIAPADQYLCINAGMNDYMQKPVKLATLTQAFKMWAPQLIDQAAA